MNIPDIIKFVSNKRLCERFNEDLLELEASCDLIAYSDPDELHYSIDMLLHSLLRFKSSKYDLLVDAVKNNPNQIELFPDSTDLPE